MTDFSTYLLGFDTKQTRSRYMHSMFGFQYQPLGKYIHEQLSPEISDTITPHGWIIEITPENINPVNPELLKEGLLTFFEVFESILALTPHMSRSQPVQEPLRSLLINTRSDWKPTVNDLKTLNQDMLTSIAGGIFICEKAIRKGNTVCVGVG